MLEDLMADYVELKASVASGLITEQMIHSAPFKAASKLHKLVQLSTAMEGDASFARQTRRKYL
jgi:hypothetical protein